MAKGLFTQGFAILLQQYAEIESFRPILADFNIVNEMPANDHWEFSGPSLIIEFDKTVNGLVSLDIVNRSWPDHMGDPKQESMLFMTWGMGHFGPYAFPDGLKRAIQQSWAWPEAKTAVPQHTGFVRIKSTYAFGAGGKDPVIPKNYSALKELHFLTGLTAAALRHPSVLCYFNPGGEVLLNSGKFNESVTRHTDSNVPPMNLWTNIRLFNFSESWLFMDSVGSWQFDLPDHEIAFPKDKFSPQEVDWFIRNTTLYLLEKGMVIKDGDTIDGPGEIRWQAKTFKNSLTSPPREVIRWLPTGISNIPPALLQEK